LTHILICLICRDLVREFASSKPRFAPNEDPRVFEGTKKAFEELAAGGPLEFPTQDWSREKTVEWWNTMGPAFAGVNAAWAGETPTKIEEQVLKTDLVHEDIPVRILKQKDTVDSNLSVVVYLHGGGFSGANVVFSVTMKDFAVTHHHTSSFIL